MKTKKVRVVIFLSCGHAMERNAEFKLEGNSFKIEIVGKERCSVCCKEVLVADTNIQVTHNPHYIQLELFNQGEQVIIAPSVPETISS